LNERLTILSAIKREAWTDYDKRQGLPPNDAKRALRAIPPPPPALWC